jgi:hypothetical protein
VPHVVLLHIAVRVARRFRPRRRAAHRRCRSASLCRMSPSASPSLPGGGVMGRWRSVGRSNYFTYSHVGYLARRVFSMTIPHSTPEKGRE